VVTPVDDGIVAAVDDSVVEATATVGDVEPAVGASDATITVVAVPVLVEPSPSPLLEGWVRGIELSVGGTLMSTVNVS
jgi:hypothetical protein